MYLQYLVVFTQVSAGWCHRWVETANSVSTHPRHQPAATWVNTTRYCKYSQALLVMGETANAVPTHPRHQPAATWVNTTRYSKYSQALLVMGETANTVSTHPRHQPAATWWTLPDTVNTVKCCWWWAKTSPETCRAD